MGRKVAGLVLLRLSVNLLTKPDQKGLSKNCENDVQEYTQATIKYEKL
jgi:hypothetical protein